MEIRVWLRCLAVNYPCCLASGSVLGWLVAVLVALLFGAGDDVVVLLLLLLLVLLVLFVLLVLLWLLLLLLLLLLLGFRV